MLSYRLLAGHSGRFASALLGRTFRLLSKHRRTRVQGRAFAGLRPRASKTASKTAKEHPMITGTVKFYNDQKGFGFIQPEDGSRDVFVHATALERAGMGGLVEGQKVSFDTAEDRRSGKIAVNTIQTA